MQTKVVDMQDSITQDDVMLDLLIEKLEAKCAGSPGLENLHRVLIAYRVLYRSPEMREKFEFPRISFDSIDSIVAITRFVHDVYRHLGTSFSLIVHGKSHVHQSFGNLFQDRMTKGMSRKLLKEAVPILPRFRKGREKDLHQLLLSLAVYSNDEIDDDLLQTVVDLEKNLFVKHRIDYDALLSMVRDDNPVNRIQAVVGLGAFHLRNSYLALHARYRELEAHIEDVMERIEYEKTDAPDRVTGDGIFIEPFFVTTEPYLKLLEYKLLQHFLDGHRSVLK